MDKIDWARSQPTGDLGLLGGHAPLGPIRRGATIRRWVPSSPLDPGHFEYGHIDFYQDWDSGGGGDQGGGGEEGGGGLTGGGGQYGPTWEGFTMEDLKVGHQRDNDFPWLPQVHFGNFELDYAELLKDESGKQVSARGPNPIEEAAIRATVDKMLKTLDEKCANLMPQALRDRVLGQLDRTTFGVMTGNPIDGRLRGVTEPAPGWQSAYIALPPRIVANATQLEQTLLHEFLHALGMNEIEIQLFMTSCFGPPKAPSELADYITSEEGTASNEGIYHSNHVQRGFPGCPKCYETEFMRWDPYHGIVWAKNRYGKWVQIIPETGPKRR